jgi:hypothetical protein
MIPLTTSKFEKQYAGVKVKFATYTEGDLRGRDREERQHAQQSVHRDHDLPVRDALVREERLTDLSKKHWKGKQ